MPRPRTKAIAQWLKHRGVRVTAKDAALHAAGFRIRVVGGNRLPGNVGQPALLDAIAEGTTLAPALVRVTDRDPGRCLFVTYLDQIPAALRALEDQEVTRS